MVGSNLLLIQSLEHKFPAILLIIQFLQSVFLRQSGQKVEVGERPTDHYTHQLQDSETDCKIIHAYKHG